MAEDAWRGWGGWRRGIVDGVDTVDRGTEETEETEATDRVHSIGGFTLVWASAVARRRLVVSMVMELTCALRQL